MKSLLYATLFIPVLFFSCKQKEQQCAVPKVKSSVNIAFVGFTKAQLNKLWVSSYLANNNFQNFRGSDTIISPDTYLTHDTAFASTLLQPFAQLKANSDYELIIPSVHASYRITNIQYGTDTMAIWNTTGDCGTQSSYPQYAESIMVNGFKVLPSYDFGSTPYFFLHQ